LPMAGCNVKGQKVSDISMRTSDSGVFIPTAWRVAIPVEIVERRQTRRNGFMKRAEDTS